MSLNRLMYICIPVTPNTLPTARARLSQMVESLLLPDLFHTEVKRLLDERPDDIFHRLQCLVDEFSPNAAICTENSIVFAAMLREAVISDPSGRKEPLQ